MKIKMKDFNNDEYVLLVLFAIVGVLLRHFLFLCNSGIANLNVGIGYDVMIYIVFVTILNLYLFIIKKPTPRIAQSVIIGLGAGYGFTTIYHLFHNPC